MKKLFLCLACLFLTTFLNFGCATQGPSDPQSEMIRRVVATGGLIALDIDALQNNGATPEERADLERHVNQALALVGVDSRIGQQLSRLLADYLATGIFARDAWKSGVRMLLEYTAEPSTVK